MPSGRLEWSVARPSVVSFASWKRRRLYRSRSPVAWCLRTSARECLLGLALLTCASPVRSWGLQVLDLMSQTSSFGYSSRLRWSCPHGPEFLCIVGLWHADLVKLGTSNFSLCCTGQGGKLEHGTSSPDDLTLNSPSRLFERDMTIPICSILSLTARCLLEVLKEGAASVLLLCLIFVYSTRAGHYVRICHVFIWASVVLEDYHE